MGEEWRRGEGNDEEEGIMNKEELKVILRKLKDDKAVGCDGIPNEVWKYGGESLEEGIRQICNRVWRGEQWPEMWKEGRIVSVIKGGEGKEVRDYRGITLMPTSYKIYTTWLAEKLREEVEEKRYYHNVKRDSEEGWERWKTFIH